MRKIGRKALIADVLSVVIFMENDGGPSLLDMIDSIQKSKLGDPARLAEIRERLVNGRTIYNSDKAYVRHMFQEIQKITPDETKSPPDAEYGFKGRADVQDNPNRPFVEPGSDAPPARERYASDQAGHSSRAWYFLPIFLWLLGGLISYACLRKGNPSLARKTLILGTGLSVPAIVVLILAIVAASTGNYGITTVDLSDEEIRGNAVQIPYEDLMGENEQYVGEIVSYEGQIVQVAKSGSTYVLRIATSTDGLVASDAVWANHRAGTDEEVKWLDEVNKSQSPFETKSAENTAHVFGIVKGLKEYGNLFGGTVTVPEIDVLILERNAVSDAGQK